MLSFLKKLFGKGSGKSAGGKDWAAITAAATKAAKSLQRPGVALDLQLGKPVRAEPHSSIGGQPSLAKGEGWPIFAAGKPMIFLAQINYAEMPKLEGYPEAGLLSVFVADDDVNGCTFPSRDQSGFALRWYPDPSGLERRARPVPVQECTPFEKELASSGAPLAGRAAIFPICAGYRYDALCEGWHPDCPHDLEDKFHDGQRAAKPGEVYYGGHADFTQGDFRYDEDDPAFTEVLLQIGYLHKGPPGWGICWGDAGEACFLLPVADLAARRFENAAYNWDCC